MSLEHSPARQKGHSRKRNVFRAPRDWAKAQQHGFVDCWLTRQEAADLLGLKYAQLAHDAVDQRLGIPFAKFGQLARYRLSRLIEWAESKEVVPPPEPPRLVKPPRYGEDIERHEAQRRRGMP